MRFLRGFYFDADKGSGGGGSDDPDTDTDTTDNPTAPGGRLHPDRLKAEHGSAEAALQVLAMKLNTVEADNAKYRQQIRDLQGQVPGDEAVVLEGDEASAWQAYQELGAPDELRQQRKQYQTLQRRQTLTEAAAAAGYKVPVLERLAGDLTVELREEQVDGKAVKVPYVAPEDGEATPLTDYAKEQWGDFLPALQAEESSSGGRTFINQTPAGGGTSKDRVEQFLEQKREREAEQKSPLDP